MRLTQSQKLDNPLRVVRMRLGLSQQELSRRSGIDSRRISAIENGTRTLRLATYKRLARALGIEITDLFPDEYR